MKLFSVRHGQTTANAQSLVCGISDVELTGTGCAQAKELAGRLKRERDKNDIRYILVSPLKRARKTASYIEDALGITAEVEPSLHEINCGVWEMTDVHDPGFRAAHDNYYSRFEGGESPFFVAQRIFNLLDRVKREYDGNVLLVCHGSVMRTIDLYFTDHTYESYKAFNAANCELREYEF